VEGIELRPIPEVARLQERLLGRGLDRSAVHAWWEQHKEEVCPLNSSKLRWCVESLLGNRKLAMMLSQGQKELVIWGYLHSIPMHPEIFEFRDEGRAGVKMVAHRRPPSDVEVAKIEAVRDEMILETLRNAALGEVFAASSFNMLRLFYGPRAGQLGANPAKIAKLFSAAKSTKQPGSSGWQRFDDTWNCTDEKDAFGRVVCEQGRVLWSRGLEQGECLQQPGNPNYLRTANSHLLTPTPCRAHGKSGSR
jgi:hypothetical protein